MGTKFSIVSVNKIWSPNLSARAVKSILQKNAELLTYDWTRKHCRGLQSYHAWDWSPELRARWNGVISLYVLTFFSSYTSHLRFVRSNLIIGCISHWIDTVVWYTRITHFNEIISFTFHLEICQRKRFFNYDGFRVRMTDIDRDQGSYYPSIRKDNLYQFSKW